MTTRVLVTDGETRAALAIVRSLGRAGCRVYVCSTARRCLAGASGFAVAETRVPSPLSEPERYLDALEELLRRWSVELLLPAADISCFAILPAKERFAGVAIPGPTAEAYRLISDKEHVRAVAEKLGICVPRQVSFEARDRALGADPAGLGYPLVLKPSRSVAADGSSLVRSSISYVIDEADLMDKLAALSPAAFPVLLQERIQGGGEGIFLLRWNGRILAHFAHRRIREKPPSGGVSVYRESIAPDPGLLRRSVALLEHYDWQGVAMVEFKVEPGSGEAYLMEVNGRFWGSLQLAVDAGVDFPALLVRAARGERIEPVAEYRVGVRSRWLWGDVDHLLARLRGTVPSYLRADLPPRWRSVLDFLRWRPGDRCEVLRLRDPKPFLRESAAWLRGRGG